MRYFKLSLVLQLMVALLYCSTLFAQTIINMGDDENWNLLIKGSETNRMPGNHLLKADINNNGKPDIIVRSKSTVSSHVYIIFDDFINNIPANSASIKLSDIPGTSSIKYYLV